MTTIHESPGDGKYFFPMDECARMNCDKAAVALLTFSPPDAKAWLYDLEQPDPSGGIMLCRKHANATVVPMAWQLVDARDPAWPGQVGAQPAAQAMAAATAEELVDGRDAAASMPSDTTAIDEEFAALRTSDLPVTPRRYAEPQLATARSAGRSASSDLAFGLDRDRSPDPSLFELPLADIPAVTPHPKYGG